MKQIVFFPNEHFIVVVVVEIVTINKYKQMNMFVNVRSIHHWADFWCI